MKIKALVPFSTGTISMEQYEVKEVTDTIGEQLVAAGVAVEIGGGSGGGVLVVTDTDGTLDKTWQEIHDAMLVGGAVVCYSGDSYIGAIEAVRYNNKAEEYTITASTGVGRQSYSASSASGYPTLAE